MPFTPVSPYAFSIYSVHCLFVHIYHLSPIPSFFSPPFMLRLFVSASVLFQTESHPFRVCIPSCPHIYVHISSPTLIHCRSNVSTPLTDDGLSACYSWPAVHYNEFNSLSYLPFQGIPASLAFSSHLITLHQRSAYIEKSDAICVGCVYLRCEGPPLLWYREVSRSIQNTSSAMDCDNYTVLHISASTSLTTPRMDFRIHFLAPSLSHMQHSILSDNVRIFLRICASIYNRMPLSAASLTSSIFSTPSTFPLSLHHSRCYFPWPVQLRTRIMSPYSVQPSFIHLHSSH